jgi:GNAT superfamily N-acetyltransferase
MVAWLVCQWGVGWRRSWFLPDTKVRREYQWRGIAAGLVSRAVGHAGAAGCQWLQVDLEEHLAPFYFGVCGFQPTPAGLIHLPSLPVTD